METTKTSKQWLLDHKDFIKGLVVTVISAGLTAAYEAITTGGISYIHWGAVGGVALTSGIAYLLKNLGTSSQEIVKK